MTKPDDLSALKDKPFAEAIDKFEKLLTHAARAFLIGAGCSKCAGLPLTAELTDKVIGSDDLDSTSKKILNKIKNRFDGARGTNIEDYLSELIDLLAIAERRVAREAARQSVSLDGGEYTVFELRAAADQIKQGIAHVIEVEPSIEIHQRFVQALHRPLRVGRGLSLDPVDYLVLNYDTVLENALALERVPYSDGLDGGVTAWWNPKTFYRDGLAARVLKLHGSVDWCQLHDESLPRRVGPSIKVDPSIRRRILIWPASTKYRETQRDPYAKLAELARAVLRPNGGSQRVLVICGYSFGDAHINVEIDRALRESSGNLTVVAFTHEDGPWGQLKTWYEDASVHEQVLIFANRGFFHGTHSKTATNSLLWWKFENITRLLEGER